jgi:hypothetical protein
MINSTALDPRKWLEILERVSLLGLVMHAMPSVHSMQSRVGRTWGEDSLEEKDNCIGGNMASVSTTRTPVAYVMLDFQDTRIMILAG